ncbi:hypothetical protein [Alkaliphilus sp. B6464]|uniref:hypothetical protein n=1 Tax=Alkaliphilus sp. B6464 TaxID=2731219 RepID=UPI001BAAE3C9|nr:hypothetical protein [Alkaliphilus sp. B6464]QUH18948.1 hypothetical protein HYG84_03040 [Alkaliphilus sp. B6464]
MLSKKLEVIKSLLNCDDEKATSIATQIDNLMSSDIITATLLSRKQKITVEQSNHILKFLVDEDILKQFNESCLLVEQSAQWEKERNKEKGTAL